MDAATAMEVVPACVTCGSDKCISSSGWRCPEALIPVDAERFEEFDKAFGKLVARAKRLGCELPTYEVVTEWSVVFWNKDAFGRRWSSGARVKGVRVRGPRPKFAGWSLVATLEPLPGADVNLIKSVPGAGELPESFRTGTHCEHCNKRRWRSETFVVRHEDGRLMRVGRNCIGDFLGGMSPATVAAMFKLATDCAAFGGADDEEMGGWGARRPSVWDLTWYVALVIRDINATGWLPRSIARERGCQSTADSAFERMIGNSFTGRKPEVPSEEELTAAREAIAWAAELTGRSDFEHNIAAIARTGVVTMKTFGMAAAIYNAYQRHMEREIERRRIACSTANSTHVGAVKERIDVVATVTAIYDSESEWGCTRIHTFVDTNGNVLKWFSSRKRLEIGETYRVRGTVKAHGEYKGRKETTLTRCVVSEASQKATSTRGRRLSLRNHAS